MILGAAAQWVAFGVFSVLGVAGALGMATTMSMFRSGIFLMASFLGVAGLFILLSADLLGLLQVMMYVGGMLVMILFMVLFSHDPGGAMMAGMDMARLEKLFSRGIAPMQMAHGGQEPHHGEAGGHAADDGNEGSHGGGSDHGGMDMSMTTPLKRQAAVLAALVGVLLVAMLLARPHWPLADAAPDPRSAHQVGALLMHKYMIAFEGAGLLILLGIFGAVLLARPGEYPDAAGRAAPVAVEAAPAPLHEDRVAPLSGAGRRLPELEPRAIHADPPAAAGVPAGESEAPAASARVNGGVASRRGGA